jgi:probable selenium-dependent hydroxylase accessory protein YqeC
MWPKDRRPSPEDFDLGRYRYLYFIGGGGKSSLLLSLASVLASRGFRVLVTTSTRMRRSEAEAAGPLLLGSSGPDLLPRIKAALAHGGCAAAASSLSEGEGKVLGLSTEAVDALWMAGAADYLLVEADGSAGRSLKAHADHEPVVSARAHLVVAVIGVDCLGQPIDDAHIHRAQLFSERLGRPMGLPIRAEDVAGIFFHPDGYLRKISRASEVAVFLNKAETPGGRQAADLLAEALRMADTGRRIGRMILGNLKG